MNQNAYIPAVSAPGTPSAYTPVQAAPRSYAPAANAPATSAQTAPHSYTPAANAPAPVAPAKATSQGCASPVAAAGTPVLASKLQWNDRVPLDCMLDVGPDDDRVLEDKDYFFKVDHVEVREFAGSAKVPPCTMVVVYLLMHAGQRQIMLQDRFYMLRNFLWKAAAFYDCIGLRKPNQSIRMDWNQVTGRLGWAHVTQVVNEAYPGKSFNNIGKYHPWHEDLMRVYTSEYGIPLPPAVSQPVCTPVAPPADLPF